MDSSLPRSLPRLHWAMRDESPHEADASLSSPRGYSDDEKCPGSLCSYASCPEFKTRKTNELEFLFHNPCDTCSSFRERKPLCKFCSHFRLRHLMICLRDNLTSLRIDLNHVDEHRDSGSSRVTTSKGCAFCELIAKAIGSYLEISGKNDEVRRAQTSVTLELIRNHNQGKLVLKLILPRAFFHEVELRYAPTSTASIRTPPKSIIQKLVDWDRIQGWLSHCNQEHSCKRSKCSAVPEGFRLIDVENRCVTSKLGQHPKLGVDIKFVAFSYVWGESNVSQDNALLNSNKSEFEAAGGLKKGKIPQAIEDAITICKRLKQRYLWVDRLCIIQKNDDRGEKQRHIDAMGDIYSSAEFTIIHASGESMNCPILGVSKERKVLQSQSVISGMEFTIAYLGLGAFLETSKWATRGWTYQEAILSPRKLFFTHFEVWFQCKDPDDPYRREEHYSTPRRIRDGLDKEIMAQFRANPLSDLETFVFTNFVRHLESYTARSLTNQSDILNAFTGILASVYEGRRSFHGLPEDDFDQALLWYCENDDRPTRCGEDFPSWSWTSVSERVTALVSGSRKGFIGTLVWWAYRDPDGGLRAIRPYNSLQPRPEPIIRSKSPRIVRFGKESPREEEGMPDYSPQIHLLFAWWKGCIEAPIPEDLEQQLESYSEDDESGIAGRWPTLEKVWEDIKCARNGGPEALIDLNIGLRKEDQPLIDKLPSRALLTRAQTALFTVSRRQDGLFHDLFILDTNGKSVGMIDPRHVSVTGAAITESNPSQDLSEFMAISLSQNRRMLDDRFQPSSRGLYNDGGLSLIRNRLFPTRDRFRDERPVVNVLLIGRSKGSWLAHRISVGWVYLEDWHEAQREFKTIALE